MIQENSKRLSDNKLFCYFAVFAAGLLVYTVTCSPGVLWQDSGLFVYRIMHNSLDGNLGLALSHPLYIMIGIVAKSIPIGDMAWRVNMISAVSGAIAVANLFLLVRLWLGKTLPAIVSAISLLVAWTFWQHAVIAEVYTLYAAQMLGELIILLIYIRSGKAKYLYILALMNGLSISNHMWAIFPAACYFVYVAVLAAKKRVSFKNIAIMILLWIVGAAPYEYLIVKSMIVTGDIGFTIKSALFGNGWESGVTNAKVTAKIIVENFIFIVLNFPTPNLLLMIAGLWALKKRSSDKIFSVFIIVLMGMYFLFAFRYAVPDRYAFFLPFYCFAAMLVGVGTDWLLQKYSSRTLAVVVLCFAMMPAVVYCFTPTIGKKYYKSLGQRRQRPYRDEYIYFLCPWKAGYDGPERFGREALEVAAQDSVIYVDTTSVHAVLYVQEYEGLRKDVQVISDYDKSEGAAELTEALAREYINKGALYVSSPEKGYCPGYLFENYDFQQIWPIYKVVPKNSNDLKED